MCVFVRLLACRLGPSCRVAVVGGAKEESDAAQLLRLPYIPIATLADLGRVTQVAHNSVQAAEGLFRVLWRSKGEGVFGMEG